MYADAGLFKLSFPSINESEFATDFERTEPITRGSAARCPACGTVVGLKRWLPPYRGQVTTWGKGYGDMLLLMGEQIVVSERFKEEWGKSHLSGLSGFEYIEIVDVIHRGARLGDQPKYFLAEVSRSRAAIDLGRSRIVWDGDPPSCDECRQGGAFLRVDSIVVEDVNLVKDDVCVIRGLPGVILVRNRFRQFFERNEFTNIKFIPLDEFSIDNS